MYRLMYILLLYFPLKIFSQGNSSNQLTSYDSDTTIINSLNNNALKYLNDKGNRSMLYAERALELSTQLKYTKGYTESNYVLGRYYETQYNYDTAYFFLNRAKESAQNKESPILSLILRALARIYYLQNEYSMSIKYNFEAVDILMARKQNAELITTYFDIGIAYHLSENYEESLTYYLKSLRLAKYFSDNQSIARALNWIGYSYSKLKKDTLALEYQYRALKIAEQIQNQSAIAIYTSSIGDLYRENKNYAKALEYILKASELFKKQNHVQGYSYTLMSSANCYEKLNILNKAEANALDAFALAQQIKAQNTYLECATILYNVYKKKNEFAKALKYFEISNNLRTTIFNRKMYDHIAKIQNQNALKEKNKETEALKSKLAIQFQLYQLKKYQMNILIAIITFILLLTGSIYLYFRQKAKTLLQEKKILLQEQEIQTKDLKIRETKEKLLEIELEKQTIEKARLNSELKYKNNEIINLAVHITQKNEMLEMLRTELKHLRTTIDSKHINTLINTINQASQLDMDREKFQLYVEEEHISFFLKLEQLLPNITRSEKKLLALLKMNLSSKEIAGIISISPASVNTKRYRLRKKLGIETDENLIQYLQKL